MSLNIKNAHAEGLARRVASATGESVTRAVAVALQERLDRLDRSQGRSAEQRAEALRGVARDSAARWVEPYRSLDHGDLLYDDAGLPS